MIFTCGQDHDMWLGHDGCGDLSLSCKIWTIIMWLLLFSHELVFTRDYPVAAACPCPGLIIRLTRWCFQGNHQESITITITSSEPILMSDSYLIRSEDWIKKESIHVCCKLNPFPAHTVLADKIRSNIFRPVFWTPGLAPVILDIVYLVALVLTIPNWYYISL